jgi:hypothetical protein
MRRAEDDPAPERPKHSGGRPKPGFLPREEGVGHAGEEGRRRRCGTGRPRQTRRERGPFRAAVDMEEVWRSSDDARQSAPGTAIIMSMLRVLVLPVLIAARPKRRSPAQRIVMIRATWPSTKGERFRLESVSGSGSRVSTARKRTATRPNAPAKSCWNCKRRTAPRRGSRGARWRSVVSVEAGLVKVGPRFRVDRVWSGIMMMRRAVTPIWRA